MDGSERRVRLGHILGDSRSDSDGDLIDLGAGENMTSLDLRLYEKIVAGIAEAATNGVDNLARGMATSFDDYRYRVGYLKGLQDVAKIAKDAQDEILGLERKKE